MTQSTKTAVIIGGGVAGATCAAELSKLLSDTDRAASVLLISPQTSIQTPVTLATLTRHAADVSISEKVAEAWCNANGVKHVQDTAISLSTNRVHLASGATIQFDAACICTGARPSIPAALTSAEFRNVVLSVRDAASVERLREAVSSARRVVVVGNGGVGMEVVHEVASCDVVWVVRDAYVGGAFFDERSAKFLQVVHAGAGGARVVSGSSGNSGGLYGGGVGPGWLRRRVGIFGQDEVEKVGAVTEKDRQVRLVERCEVAKLQRDEKGVWPVVAVLSTGEEVGCDVIVAGTGVCPNVEWLAGSGVAIDRTDRSIGGGVVVDADGMYTSVRGIFAAGDCTTVESSIVGENWFQMRLWTQAMTAGRTAALGMVAYMTGVDIGSGLDFEVFAHATSFFGQSIVFLGRYCAQGISDKYEFIESSAEDRSQFIRAVLVGGRLCGALLVGQVERAETFENLIIDGLNVEHLKAELVDLEAELEDYFD